MDQMYVRLSPQEREWVERVANSENIRFSEVLRRAVRMQMFGGAEQYAAEVARRLREPQAVPPHVQALGNWMASLPQDVAHMLFITGTALAEHAGGRPLADIPYPQSFRPKPSAPEQE